MKLIIVPILLLTVAGCGKSDSSAPTPCSTSVFAGSWRGVVNGQVDTLTFGASCSYADSLCQGTGTYPNVTANSGQVLVTITSTNSGSSCLPVGQTACTYSISGQTANYNCGSGTFVFTKQ